MARIYDCSVDTELLTGTRLARAALSRGELVVMPTDTVYGIAANAFDAKAVQRLLEAKGRTRQAPPPVLIGDLATLDALAESVPDAVRDLARAFWPGGLTIVLHAQSSLVWDLGDTEGTVALRMPDNPIALELLADTGPLAVSSANKTGEPAARTAEEAFDALGESVEVYLDGGAREQGAEGADSEASTIVDATALDFEGGTLRILRQGVVSEERIREIVGNLLPTEEERAAAAAAVVANPPSEPVDVVETVASVPVGEVPAVGEGLDPVDETASPSVAEEISADAGFSEGEAEDEVPGESASEASTEVVPDGDISSPRAGE